MYYILGMINIARKNKFSNKRPKGSDKSKNKFNNNGKFSNKHLRNIERIIENKNKKLN